MGEGGIERRSGGEQMKKRKREVKGIEKPKAASPLTFAVLLAFLQRFWRKCTKHEKDWGKYCCQSSHNISNCQK